jgi:chemotaxis protein histidine kinase CheA
MSAVRERIHDMNGTIDVRTSPGRGTTWIIRFPWDPHVMPGVPLKRAGAPRVETRAS